MTKTAVIYARVSTEKQAGEDKVSIPKQLDVCRAFCERMDATILGEFVDDKKYTKTRKPKKGKLVDPSGQYDDRPDFQAMLATVETGKADMIVSFDLTRIGRHFRVLGPLGDALDEGNKNRRGRSGELQIWEADKNTNLNRVMLGLLIAMAQNENEDRKRRIKMGRIGTLEQGRWPSTAVPFGYIAHQEEGKRGVYHVIDEKNVGTVQLIFDLAETLSIGGIRQELIARDIPQDTGRKIKHQWNPGVILRILTTEAYTGKRVWTFETGETYTIEIPKIIEPAQFERIQRKIAERKTKSKRNTQAIGAVQHIAVCGHCGNKLATSKRDYELVYPDGKRQRQYYDVPRHFYTCNVGKRYKMDHKTRYWGPTIDYKIWRFLVDNYVQHPQLIEQQIEERQAELQRQGDDYNSEIAQTERRIKDIEAERSRYQAGWAKGFINDAEFETHMQRTKEQIEFCQNQLIELQKLRDDSVAIRAGINYAHKLMRQIATNLPELDISPEQFRQLPIAKQRNILERRKTVIQSLCVKVTIYDTDDIDIEGVIDTDKLASFCITGDSSHIWPK
jgi:site-specific DNA recombinase